MRICLEIVIDQGDNSTEIYTASPSTKIEAGETASAFLDLS